MFFFFLKAICTIGAQQSKHFFTGKIVNHLLSAPMGAKTLEHILLINQMDSRLNRLSF
mgnify:CR=1 FL=1